MPDYVPIYIATTDVKDVTLTDALTRAAWTDANIKNISIRESESYIEAKLTMLGYSRTQLLTSDLVKTLCIKYAKYVTLRDIYTQNAPSRSPGEQYEKWKDEVNGILESISKNETRLVNSTTGLNIDPANGDARFEVKSTTADVKRAITMDDEWTWGIDSKTYADTDVVGQK